MSGTTPPEQPPVPTPGPPPSRLEPATAAHPPAAPASTAPTTPAVPGPPATSGAIPQAGPPLARMHPRAPQAMLAPAHQPAQPLVPYPRPPVLPARPSVLARRWPAPNGDAAGAVLGAVATAAVVGAVSIPLDRPGVGWLVSVTAGTAALGVAAWQATRSGATGAPDRAEKTGPVQATGQARQTGPVEASGQAGQTGQAETRPVEQTSQDGKSGQAEVADQTTGVRPAAPGRPRLSVTRLLWIAATVVLVGVGTVRTAGWLFVLCLLTAGVTACLAVTDGRSVRGLLLAGVIPPVAVVRAVPWAVTGLRRLGGGPSLSRGVATVGVSIGLLVVFGALFASADAAFAELLGRALPDLSIGTVFRWSFLFVVIGAGLLGAALLVAAPPDLTGLDARSTRRVRRLEWAVPVALLDVLFAAFVLVQVTVLFGGSDHVLRTSGLTFAQYARSGFWQLLSVTALTLLVIAGAARWAPRDGRADRLLIRLLLGALGLLSLVVVASALYRMDVYVDAYGATRLRLLVATCELWLGLVFVLVLGAGIRLRAGWLPRVVIASAVLALLGLAVVNPDRMIADRNVARYEATRKIDVGYLSRLSADAAPALDQLPDNLRDCALAGIADDLTDHPDDWRGWNLARARARESLAADPVSRRLSGCPPERWTR